MNVCAGPDSRDSLSLPAEPVWLDADATRLSQVLGNLLNNAAKYTPPGGKVRLAATLVAGAVEIDFADSGIGIAREQIGQLFQMFTQLPNAASHSQGGLGIGLALVRRLVELHGGSVRASSPGVGHGSTFTVVLPIEASLRAAAVRLEPQLPAKRTPGVRVLVVEDNDMDLDFCMQAFEEHAIANPVIACRDGEAALQFMDACPTPEHPQFPLLVLLDLRLPKVDGIEVLRHARQHPVWKQVPFIMLTTSREHDDIAAAYQLGVNSYIVKPVDFFSFAEVVKHIKMYWILTNEAPFDLQRGP